MNVDTKNIADGASSLMTMLTIDLGATGNGQQFMVGGWSSSENDWRWMTGDESELRISTNLVNGDYLIELDLHPFVEPTRSPAQRLGVSVNGIGVGQSRIAHDGRIGFRIPAAALAGRHVANVVFAHPDAVRPCDVRPSRDARSLSLAVSRLRLSRIRDGTSGRFVRGTGGIGSADLERRVGFEPVRLMSQFESLGDNCEFGLVQRRCGAELFFSLLRFAGMELPTLLRALELGMQDFGDAANMEIRLDDKPRPEYVAHELRYRVFFHTFRYEGETDPARLHVSESKRLAYCAKRFIGSLRQANKILVVKRNEPLREDEILPLYAALSSYGPNQLLWMVPADEKHPSGSVEVVLPGLFRGFIERFAPLDDAPNLLLEDWLEVCANAYLLAQEERVAAEGLIAPSR